MRMKYSNENFPTDYNLINNMVGIFLSLFLQVKYPAGKYLFKVNNKSTRARCEIFSKLTIKTPERRD